MSHIALTEVNGLWGFIRFVQLAKEQGIKAIAGTNLITEMDNVILLAENQTGYENMCRIISCIHDDPDASIPNLLISFHSGLFILTHQDSVLELLSKFIPNSHLFVELRPGIAEAEAQTLANAYQLEIIATGDVYFLSKEDYHTHRILRTIDLNTTLSQLPPNETKDQRHFFRSEKEMIDLFPNSMTAINNSQYLAERCKTDWTYTNTIFPDLSLKNTHRANKALRSLVTTGAHERYGKINGLLKKRINYELSLITQKGFAPYFLIVRDIVQQTESTIGRGSGAASVVSYCLYITQVDPLRYNLQFERFIHPERMNMPDIDIDFPWDERDKILDYIFNKYSTERSAMVSSQVFLQPRSSIREVSKVYGLSEEEIKVITKRIGYYSRQTELVKWVRNNKRFKNLDLDDTIMETVSYTHLTLPTKA